MEGTQTVHKTFGDYDNFGRPLSTSVAIGSVTQASYSLTTDTLGRVETVAATTVGSWSGTLAYGYYDNGMVKSIDATFDGGSSIGLRYNRWGEDFFLNNIKSQSGTTLVSITGRDAFGHATSMTSAGATIGLVYDSLGRPTNQSVQAGTPYLSRSWHYDARGRVDQVEEAGASAHTYDFFYDEPGWLKEERKDGVTTASYGYDDAGNRTSKTVGSTTTSYGYDYGNRLTSVDAVSNVWNAFGEIEEDHRGYTIVHNADGTELGLEDPAGNAVADFVRDPSGRPIGVDTSSTNRHRQLWGDSTLPIVEWNTTGGGFFNVEVEGIQVGTWKTSLTSVVSDPQGTLMRRGSTWKPRPDTFGSGVTGTTGDENWAGMEVLGSSPYQLAQNRLYDGETGRFSSADPIGLAGGAHRFAYVGNNPATFVDPTGLYAQVSNAGRSSSWIDSGMSALASVDSARAGADQRAWARRNSQVSAAIVDMLTPDTGTAAVACQQYANAQQGETDAEPTDLDRIDAAATAEENRATIAARQDYAKTSGTVDLAAVASGLPEALLTAVLRADSGTPIEGWWFNDTTKTATEFSATAGDFKGVMGGWTPDAGPSLGDRVSVAAGTAIDAGVGAGAAGVEAIKNLVGRQYSESGMPDLRQGHYSEAVRKSFVSTVTGGGRSFGAAVMGGIDLVRRFPGSLARIADVPRNFRTGAAIFSGNVQEARDGWSEYGENLSAAADVLSAFAMAKSAVGAGAGAGVAGRGASGGAPGIAGRVAKAMEGAPLKPTQGNVSGPKIERMVEAIEGGAEMPAIKVDGGYIVDGHHRYIAGQVAGKPVATVPGGSVPAGVKDAAPTWSEVNVLLEDY